MVEHQSKEVIDKISDELKIQPALQIPKELMDKIQLAYNINPPILTTLFKERSESGSGGTVFTTDARLNTFVTGIMMSIQKDVTSTVIAYAVRGVVGGATVKLGQMNFLSVTISDQHMYLQFKDPVKLDVASAVSTTISGGGVGNHSAETIIHGFTTDPQ